MALLQHIAVVGNLEGQRRILLHHQDRQALCRQTADRDENLVNDDRRKAEAGFVEQQ